MEKLLVFRDLLALIWERRAWWLIPFVAMLLVLAGLVIVSQSSVIAPFIYPLF